MTEKAGFLQLFSGVSSSVLLAGLYGRPSSETRRGGGAAPGHLGELVRDDLQEAEAVEEVEVGILATMTTMLLRLLIPVMTAQQSRLRQMRIRMVSQIYIADRLEELH